MNLNKIKYDKSLNNEELYVKASAGCAGSKELLFKNNIALVNKMVQRLFTNGSTEDRDELLSVGLLGLTKAYNGYDISRGLKFSTYAGFVIKRELYSFVKSKTYKMRSKYETISLEEQVKGFENDVSYHELITDDSSNDPYEHLFDTFTFNEIISRKLTSNEADILIKKIKYELSFEEISKFTKTSRQRVHQIYKKAIEKLLENEILVS